MKYGTIAFAIKKTTINCIQSNRNETQKNICKAMHLKNNDVKVRFKIYLHVNIYFNSLLINRTQVLPEYSKLLRGKNKIKTPPETQKSPTRKTKIKSNAVIDTIP